MKRCYSTILAVLVIAITIINLYLVYSLVMSHDPTVSTVATCFTIIISYCIIAIAYLLLTPHFPEFSSLVERR
jgi:heme/copper-type cytochrome/quinol oxidase subunit 4